ncbi:universal stress protein [Streptomyces griseorubiginosus]|uniref:universal stress protein n=1 Tax=Streptomyces griseorubiginosus TaxID=67304 RepID=UPI001AD77226|nr:universal stress protein [Streptomyces griseorubiginosus]MBO4252533.1 universal stress protein [Streptomyces griseorubiginosus]
MGRTGAGRGVVGGKAAAWEADRRRAPLRLAHALTWVSPDVPAGVAPWDPDGAGARDRVNRAFSDAEGRARRVAPHLVITREVLVGAPDTVLGSESRAACLAVVGAHRIDGARGRLHGSVAGRLTARADCPVLVVRGRHTRTGPVVLAADESPRAREAAEFAFAEASERGADLVVLRARRSGRTTADALSALREKYPHVTVRTAAVRGRHHRALVEAGVDAQLVVVGVRRGGTTVVRPGSEGRSILRDARCPVALVPAAGR